jgi:dipeptidyl aminopeptidase/acylaminoacyl peptidase
VVPIKHSEELYGAVRRAGKPVTLVKIEGLAHSAGNTPEMQQKVLTTLENYLKTDCGPGGL